MKKKTMVSVVVATFKRDQSLFKALQSLTAQSYHFFEVVVVDDNADKGWNEKVESIISQFNDILCINYIQNHDNQGSAKSRNIGIVASKGEYITFLDDDDLYLPDKIKNQLEKMIETNADFSITNFSLFNEDETLFETRKRDYLLTEESKDLLLCHLKYHLTGTDTMMFKKKYLLSFGCFEAIDVGDEFYLMVKAIEKRGIFVYCDFCDVKAYVHIDNGGLSSGKQKIDGENKLFEFKKKYFHSLSNKDKRIIRMRHYAVLAFAYKRQRKIIKFLFEGVKAFFSSPTAALRLLRSLKQH